MKLVMEQKLVEVLKLELAVKLLALVDRPVGPLTGVLRELAYYLEKPELEILRVQLL